jgi:glycosyltransferase involved in cell wall biosynthesis
MAAKSLRIAWIGAGPGPHESGGVPGVATDLLLGLTRLGHRVDCYLPGTSRSLPDRIAQADRLTFVWGTGNWRWDRWYNRAKIGTFLTGLLNRAVGSLRLRRGLAERHALEPYDLIYQFSSIEALAMPASLRRSVPLVIHPETHIAGELRFQLAEWRLSIRCQPAYVLALTVAIMRLRVLVQRRRVRGAWLLICISRVFRDHLVRDFRYPLERTVVIPNPVRLERFSESSVERAIGKPARILVLGRISARKGIDDVIALAERLRASGVEARLRVVGGPSLWSDYTPLLDDLPPENSEYAGRIAPAEIPAELEATDVLVQASKYEPFGLTVGEALAAGVPVVATSEVGAIEGVDRRVVAEVAPGDVDGLAAATVETIGRLEAATSELRGLARSEAERLFAPPVVASQVSLALERLVESTRTLGERPDRRPIGAIAFRRWRALEGREATTVDARDASPPVGR